MLNTENTKRVLEAFRRNVVREARKNLKQKSASGELANSLTSELDVTQRSFSLQFLMEEYGNYIDKGVSGTEKRYNTPFNYTTKKPPARAFEKWIKQRGIKGRDKKTGRFITDKSLSFALANHIYKKGHKPSLFFTKPFEKYFQRLPDELIEQYGLDIEDFMQFTLNNTFD